MLLVSSEGLEWLYRRVSRLFVRGSREITSVPSLHRASADALIHMCIAGSLIFGTIALMIAMLRSPKIV